MIDWGASLFGLVPLLGIAAIALYIAFRAVRALETRGRLPEGQEGLAERVGLLEEALERMHSDIERLTDAQHFTSRLLDGRAGGVEMPSSVEHTSFPATSPKVGHP